jgi:hypothetical protein
MLVCKIKQRDDTGESIPAPQQQTFVKGSTNLKNPHQQPPIWVPKSCRAEQQTNPAPRWTKQKWGWGSRRANRRSEQEDQGLRVLGGDEIVPNRSAESFESAKSSAPASVKASSPVDGAAARDPDGEWAMSPLFARLLCAVCLPRCLVGAALPWDGEVCVGGWSWKRPAAAGTLYRTGGPS